MSGGQTGVDRAALEWALANNVPHGGWCSKGRKAEDGAIPSCFHSVETDAKDDAVRTYLNVWNSDGTVIFSDPETLIGGTLETSLIVVELRKPLLRIVASNSVQGPAEELRAFIQRYAISVLNVAGPRESQAPNLALFVKAVLGAVRLLL